jgi:multidrug resistance efflux pump
VKTQITGELAGVFLKEGQDAKKANLIFTLDKRPFEAEIKRQEANLQRDTPRVNSQTCSPVFPLSGSVPPKQPR